MKKIQPHASTFYLLGNRAPARVILILPPVALPPSTPLPPSLSSGEEGGGGWTGGGDDGGRQRAAGRWVEGRAVATGGRPGGGEGGVDLEGSSVVLTSGLTTRRHARASAGDDDVRVCLVFVMSL